MIYFAQLPTGSIKIGSTDDVDRRLRDLQAHYQKPLSLLHVIPGDRETEHEIHEQFAHLRFGKKEQFKAAPELMEFIGKPLLVNANTEAVEAKRGDRVAVRLELKRADHKRLDQQAQKRDLSLASMARVAVLEWLAQQEGGEV